MSKTGNKEIKKNRFTFSRSQQIMFGVFLILFSIIVFSALFSYFSTWRADQSEIGDFFNKDAETINIAKKFGAQISDILVNKMFGLSSFIISFLLFISGLSYFVGDSIKISSNSSVVNS